MNPVTEKPTKTAITHNIPLLHTEFYDTMNATMIVVGKERNSSSSAFLGLGPHQFPFTHTHKQK